MKKQRGFILFSGKKLIAIAVGIALVGWGIGKGIEWVASHITVGIV